MRNKDRRIRPTQPASDITAPDKSKAYLLPGLYIHPRLREVSVV
jgi:hypothetical protein